MKGFKAWRRRLSLGLPTVMGLARRGFFIPYRYAESLPPAKALRPYGAVEELMEHQRGRISHWLEAIEGFAAELEAIGDRPPPDPRWDQDWFPRTDAAIAYAMARTLGPARIVEIGCGHSTRFFARAANDAGLETRITAIDPAPRADLAGVDRVELRRTTLQDVGEERSPRLRRAISWRSIPAIS